MKKIFIIVFVLLSFKHSYSQYVNGVHIKDIPAEYIRVVMTENNKYFKVTALVDYGQMNAGRDLKSNYLVDENGQEFKNVGSMFVLNLFAKNNWEYVDSNLGNYITVEYILRRKDDLN